MRIAKSFYFVQQKKLEEQESKYFNEAGWVSFSLGWGISILHVLYKSCPLQIMNQETIIYIYIFVTLSFHQWHWFLN